MLWTGYLKNTEYIQNYSKSFMPALFSRVYDELCNTKEARLDSRSYSYSADKSIFC